MDDVHVLGPANGTDIQPRRRFLDLSSATRRVATERGAEAPSHKRAASAAMLSWTAATRLCRDFGARREKKRENDEERNCGDRKKRKN